MSVPSVIARVIARVRALLPEDWRGAAGDRFRTTVDVLTKTVSEATPAKEDVPKIVTKGLHRYTSGKFTREHAEAQRNYAEEESVKIQAEFARRTLEDRIVQERAKTDQEKTRARTMRVEEAMARVNLIERLERRGYVPTWDHDGNIDIVPVESAEGWAKMRDVLLKDITSSEKKDDSKE
jgi:hypothetical protein